MTNKKSFTIYMLVFLTLGLLIVASAFFKEDADVVEGAGDSGISIEEAVVEQTSYIGSNVEVQVDGESLNLNPVRICNKFAHNIVEFDIDLSDCEVTYYEQSNGYNEIRYTNICGTETIIYLTDTMLDIERTPNCVEKVLDDGVHLIVDQLLGDEEAFTNTIAQCIIDCARIVDDRHNKFEKANSGVIIDGIGSFYIDELLGAETATFDNVKIVYSKYMENELEISVNGKSIVFNNPAVEDEQTNAEKYNNSEVVYKLGSNTYMLKSNSGDYIVSAESEQFDTFIEAIGFNVENGELVVG